MNPDILVQTIRSVAHMFHKCKLVFFIIHFMLNALKVQCLIFSHLVGRLLNCNKLNTYGPCQIPYKCKKPYLEPVFWFVHSGLL